MELRASSPGKPLWVLVPDRLQAVAFRRRLARAGGALGIQVRTFNQLYHHVLIEAGEPVPEAPDAVVHLLFDDAIQRLSEAGDLQHYAPIAGTSGFVQRMAESVAELKRAHRTPQDLSKANGGRESNEIAAIFATYQHHLERVGWEDQEGRAHRAHRSLIQQPDVWREAAALFVDGFDSLEPIQIEVLDQLAARLPELWITLPGEAGMQRAAFRRFRRTFRRLRTAFPEAEIETVSPQRDQLPADLRRLERGLFEVGAQTEAPNGQLERLEVRDPTQEAREALRWIKARMRRDGLTPDDCAVAVPDPERYRPLLRQAAQEFGIPLRSNFGERLPRAPAVAALLDLLQLPLEDWPRRELLDTVRSPYFDLEPWGLTSEDALALDAVSHHGRVVEGLEVWRETLLRLAQVAGSPEREEDADPGTPYLPYGQSAVRILSALSGFADRVRSPDRQSAGEWVRWLEDLLDDLSFPMLQVTEADKAAFERLRETLRALLLGENLGRPRVLMYPEFIEQWRSMLEGISFRQRLTPRDPAVTVLRLLEARGLRYRAFALLGLSEGLVPEIEREDPFLPEAVRAALGLEPRLGREQAGLFYQAVTRADQRLLLTRPYLADDGQAWEPSPYWRAVDRLFSDPPARLSGEAPRPLVEAGSSQELLFWGVRRGRLPASLHEPHAQRWKALQSAGDVLAARIREQARGPYEGHIDPAVGEPAQWGGDGSTWSPSRLETYGTCPHFFWTSYVLRFERRDPPELGIDAAQLGSMLHAILERAYREADQPANVDSVLDELDRVCEEEFASAPETYGFRPNPLWALEQEQWRDALEQTVLGMAELEAGWSPTAFEAVFGIEGAPALVVELPSGEVLRLRGVIDRVDSNDAGEIRLVDYKTGSSHLSRRDLVEGRRLQLPLYAEAARTALEMGEPVEGLYWSILRGAASSLRLSRFRHEEEGFSYAGPRGAFDLTLRHVERAVQEISAGHFPPEPPRGGCPSYCPAATWCWRYTPSGYA